MIPVKNIYYMLSYAFQTLRNQGIRESDVESFDNVQKLFAEILIKGIGTLIKRGIGRDYISKKENLSSIKGKIDVSGSIKTQSVIEAIRKLSFNCRLCDSLLLDELDNQAFDIVVGNPPWGKVKLSLHSFVNSNGTEHVYGSDFDKYDKKKYEDNRQSSIEYSRTLKEKYDLLGKSEPDLYMAFLQRAINSLREGGHLSFIVPAGLIRSKGTELLREYLLNVSERLVLTTTPRFLNTAAIFLAP